MKKIFIIYLLLIHFFIGVVIIKTDFVPRLQARLGLDIEKAELTPFYHTMLAFQQRIDKNIPDSSVIFIGDSLTQGLAVTAVIPRATNFGVGQDTTIGVLNRIPYYSSIKRSRAIIIAIGVNDIFRRDNNEIIQNYQKIIQLIPINIPVVFSAILPVDEILSNRIGFNTRIQKINKGLYDLCAKSPRLHYMNIAPLIVDSEGGLSGDYHVGDGLHLNGSGSQIWITELKGLFLNSSLKL